MEYFFTEEQKMIRDLAAKIATERIVPVRKELDEKAEFPREIMNEIGKADLLRIYIPQEYGGFGMGILENALVIEELSKACGAVAITYAACGLATYPILYFGNEEQKKEFLPRLGAGQELGAFAITEADAGSDAGNMKTTAEKDGEEYILNGSKHWITNGEEADIYVIFALTDKSKGSRGASAFLVEKGTPGFRFGKKENKMGIRASATTELIFENCRVPARNLLGREGFGYIIALKTLEATRIGVASQSIGIAQGALEASVAYAKQRQQFDQPIIMFQAVGHKLANMAMEIEAARALTYYAARLVDSGYKEMAKYTGMAKVFASDVCMRATTEAVQVLGGYGYVKEYPVEKMMRDAKVTQIYEGTNEVLRNLIAAGLQKGV